MCCMNIQSFKSFLNIAAAISSLVAAFCWLQSTRVRVPYQDIKDFSSAAIVLDDGTEVIETARQQTKWSKWAACAASISALCQSVIWFLYSD